MILICSPRFARLFPGVARLPVRVSLLTEGEEHARKAGLALPSAEAITAAPGAEIADVREEESV